MREMRPDSDRGFPSNYICSDCHWSFPLNRLSELGEFFQQKDANLAFSTHDCASSNAAMERRPQNSEICPRERLGESPDTKQDREAGTLFLRS
jgi:hypothetical protein